MEKQSVTVPSLIALCLVFGCERFERSPNPPVQPIVGKSYAPRQVTELGTGVKALAAGESHTCAVLADGKAKCWGSNAFGELGIGITSESEVSPVEVKELTGIESIFAGRNYSCAIVGAAERRAYCWGQNNYYQLGIGEETGGGRVRSSPWPKAVVGPLNDIERMALKVDRTCAALRNGDARCWGTVNRYITIEEKPVLKQIVYKEPTDFFGWIEGSGEATHFVSRGKDTCALISRDLRCLINTPEQNNNGIEVVAGNVHACLLRNRGEVWCWGENWQGQLGLGEGALGSSTKYAQKKTEGLSEVVKIAAGGDHTCALLKEEGTMRCWGANSSGQIGNRTASESVPAPVEVVELHNVSDIALGANHSCALRKDGTVWCWGDNTDGQLGYPTQ